MIGALGCSAVVWTCSEELTNERHSCSEMRFPLASRKRSDIPRENEALFLWFRQSLECVDVFFEAFRDVLVSYPDRHWFVGEDEGKLARVVSPFVE